MRTFRRKLGVLGIVWLVAAGISYAQLEMDARVQHSRVLQYEPVIVSVRIRSNTSKPIVLNSRTQDSRLTFDIENGPGRSVPKLKLDEDLEIEIPPHTTVKRDVNLLEIYDFRAMGPYTIRARVNWKGNSHLSPSMYVDVVPGLEIDRFVGEAPESGTDRSFSLRTLYRDRKEMVFLRIEDKEQGLCYGLLELGRIVRLNKPRMMMDRSGHIHVLHQSSPVQYTHTEVTARGRLVGRNLYPTGGGPPEMAKMHNGSVEIESHVVEIPVAEKSFEAPMMNAVPLR